MASISHSGAIASIKPAMLKEAVCFLFVTQILLTQIGDFISAPPHSSCISMERRRRADGGGWVLASGERAMRTSAFRVRYAQRGGFYSLCTQTSPGLLRGERLRPSHTSDPF